MTEHNDALAMTDEERATFDQAVTRSRGMLGLFGKRSLPEHQLLVRASEHIEALNVRNLNFGNAYRQLELSVTKIAEKAWDEGYSAGSDQRGNVGYTNPYTVPKGN